MQRTECRFAKGEFRLSSVLQGAPAGGPDPEPEQNDGRELDRGHPDAPLDPELPSREEVGTGAQLDQDGAHRLVAAHLVANDRPADDVPGEVEADGEPEPLVAG